MPHRLVKPVLQRCNADILSRLEQESPHLVEHNQELWKELCIRNYPLVTEQYPEEDFEEPESWREAYFHFREEEARRLEETAIRIRNQRLEAEEMKRKRQVKLTDRLPPPKRSRHGWSTGPTPPKTLFEKTRREATRIQKSVFGSRALPPSSSSTKGLRANLGSSSAQLSPPKSASPVTVTTVTVRSTCANTQSAFSPPPKLQNESHTTTSTPQPRPLPPPRQDLPPGPKPSGSSKKDSMAALFLPKQKAYSQLPDSDARPHRMMSR